jgi:hypothetical protein
VRVLLDTTFVEPGSFTVAETAAFRSPATLTPMVRRKFIARGAFPL